MWPPRPGPSCSAIVAAAVLLSAPAAAAQTQEVTPPRGAIRVEPRDIEVGLFYRGASVRVEGTAPPGFRLAIVCVGKTGKVELKQKGKVGSVLWMNVGTVAFEHVPSLFLISADAEPRRADRPVVMPADLRLGLGYDGVEAQVLPAHADDTTRTLFREFVRLKVQERLYAFGKLHREDPPGAAAATRVSTEFSLPASAPPGEYEIRLIGYRDGTGALLATEKVVARRVGLAHLVSSMAEHHGLLYGVLSVVAAVAAGFLSGLIFAGAKKGH